MDRHRREQELKLSYGSIYKITNRVNEKVYIGQTIRPIEIRWKQHLYRKDCTYLHNALYKYGVENFSIEVIEQVPKELLDEREIYWIAFYDSTNKSKGYNLIKGGKLGNTGKSKLTLEETEELIRLSNEGVNHTEIARRFNIERKTVTFILRRNTDFSTRYKTLSQRNDLVELKQYLKTNPTVTEVLEKFNMSRTTLFKFAKSIGYKFLNYQQRKREYNIPTSAQQPL